MTVSSNPDWFQPLTTGLCPPLAESPAVAEEDDEHSEDNDSSTYMKVSNLHTLNNQGFILYIHISMKNIFYISVRFICYIYICFYGFNRFCIL